MTAIVGLSAYYHDSAAAIVVDGQIVAAAQEERFSRIKHDAAFPRKALAYCLSKAGLTPADVDYVVFYEKPLLKFDRLLETYLSFAPRGFPSFAAAMPVWLRQKLFLKGELYRGFGGAYTKRIAFTEHHQSHAASAFYPSPFESAAVLTVDGVGEWATATFGVGHGHQLKLSHELRFPHSPGLLYTAFTTFCGFRANSGEYKLMGLAPYGSPKYADMILDQLVDLKADGSFRLNLDYFYYCEGLRMTSPRFHRLFGGPPRLPESPLTQREMDLAASIQVVIEEILLRMARHVHQVTGQESLCLAGGVALNCVANGRLLREGPFENIWVQPAAGDAGGALGAALFTWYQLLENPRTPMLPDAQQGSFLGPDCDEDAIRRFLTQIGAPFEYIPEEDEFCQRVATLIDQGKVVGWVQGRMEFGPRALGGRSILGDARNPNMQSIMNLKIKFRESFRPFAPAVLQERVHEYFETRPAEDSPYMLLVAPVHPQQRIAPQSTTPLSGLNKLKGVRSKIPAVTHVDYSARIQTVDSQRHGRYYRLLKAFESLTGCPVLINTSFNIRGEPIVCRPEEAYRCFLATNMDVLVLERFILHKGQQPEQDPAAVDRYLREFQLD